MGVFDPVVGALERRGLLGEHGPADAQAFSQAVQPGHTVRALGIPGHVVRRCAGFPADRAPGHAHAHAEDGPSTRQDVDTGHDLGQHRRIAGSDRGNHRPEGDRLGAGGQCPEDRVGLESRGTT